MTTYKELLNYYCSDYKWFADLSLSQQDEISREYFNELSIDDKYDLICDVLDSDLIEFIENLIANKEVNCSKEWVITCLTDKQIDLIIFKITSTFEEFFDEIISNIAMHTKTKKESGNE